MPKRMQKYVLPQVRRAARRRARITPTKSVRATIAYGLGQAAGWRRLGSRASAFEVLARVRAYRLEQATATLLP